MANYQHYVPSPPKSSTHLAKKHLDLSPPFNIFSPPTKPQCECLPHGKKNLGRGLTASDDSNPHRRPPDLRVLHRAIEYRPDSKQVLR